MAKNKVSKKSASSKYTHFKVHGNHSSQQIFLYVILDLAISIALGFYLQGQIIASLASGY